MKRDEALKILGAHSTELKQRYKVKSLAVYGSVSRDEARDDSDVDVLVQYEKIPGLFGYMDLKARLEELLGCAVDLGMPEALRPRIKPRVLKEAIIVPGFQALS